MPIETERKFLVDFDALRPLLVDAPHRAIDQFYLVSSKECAVRIRKASDKPHAVVTVKAGGNGMSSSEFEFEVDASHYDRHRADRVGNVVSKVRYDVIHNGRTWEIDVFGGALSGLVVAELECPDAADVTDIPDWAEDEVTYDTRYKNAFLARHGRPMDMGDMLDVLIRCKGERGLGEEAQDMGDGSGLGRSFEHWENWKLPVLDIPDDVTFLSQDEVDVALGRYRGPKEEEREISRRLRAEARSADIMIGEIADEKSRELARHAAKAGTRHGDSPSQPDFAMRVRDNKRVMRALAEAAAIAEDMIPASVPPIATEEDEAELLQQLRLHADPDEA